jgi:hypothetical protein
MSALEMNRLIRLFSPVVRPPAGRPGFIGSAGIDEKPLTSTWPT